MPVRKKLKAVEAMLFRAEIAGEIGPGAEI
jgi:hypothetical protein